MSADAPLKPNPHSEIINDCIRRAFGSAPPPTETDQIIGRAMQTSSEIFILVRDVLKADVEKNNGRYNRVAMYALIKELHRNKFYLWSKDDLLHLLTMLLSEIMIERVDEQVGYTNDKIV